MKAKDKPLFPKHLFAWMMSLITIPFGLLFSGVFINAYQIKLPEVYKYIPSLIAVSYTHLTLPTTPYV